MVKKQKIALFLGRFQPFHLGHLHVIKHLVKKGYFVKVAIGSSQEFGTAQNPFTAYQRRKMIAMSLKADAVTGKNYRIFLVPDINSDDRYVAHVKTIVGRFDIVEAAENPQTFRLFSRAGYMALRMGRWRNISSTRIRAMMKKRDGQWRPMVPRSLSFKLAAEKQKSI